MADSFTLPGDISSYPEPAGADQLFQSNSYAADYVGDQTYNFTEHVTMGAPLAVVDLVDTMASSLGFSDRQEINQAVDRVIPEVLSTYRKTHEGGIEVASAVLGIAGISKFTPALFRSGSAIGRVLSSIPGARSLVANERNARAALLRAQRSQKFAMTQQGKIDESLFADPVVTRAAKNARNMARLNAGKEGLQIEAALAIGMNENDFLFPDELDNITLGAFAAVGVAIPAVAGGWIASAQLRKFATINTPEANRLYDKAEFGLASFPEGDALTGIKLADPTNLDREIAQLAVSERALNDARGVGIDAAVVPRFESRATQLQKEWQMSSEKLVSRGIPGLVNKDPARAARLSPTIVDAVKKDPLWSIGVVGVEHAPNNADELAAMLAKHKELVNSTTQQADEIEQLIRVATRPISEEEAANGLKPATSIHWEGRSIPLAKADEYLQTLRYRAADQRSWLPEFLDGGQSVSVSEKQGNWVRFGDDPASKAKIKRVDIGDKEHVYELAANDVTNAKKPMFQMSVDMNLTPILGNTGNFETDFLSLSNYKRSALWNLMDVAVDDASRSSRMIKLGKNSNFIEIDSALEAKRRAGPGKLTILFDAGMDEVQVQMQSLSQKSLLSDRIRKAAGPGGYNKVTLRESLNLPQTTAYQRAIDLDTSPLETFFIQQADAGNPGLKGWTLDSVLEEVKSIKHFPDAVEGVDQSVTFVGNSFKLGKDAKGNALPQAFVWRRNLTQPDFTKEVFGLAQQARHAQVVGTLTDPKKSLMVSGMINSVLNTPDFIQSGKIEFLSAASIESTVLPGHTSTGALTYASNAARDNPTILAALRVRATAEKGIRAFQESLFTETSVRSGKVANTIFSELRAPNAKVSAKYFGQYYSARLNGWNLVAGPGEANNGLWAFKLKPGDTFNQQKWKDLFGQDMPEGAFMPSHQDKAGQVIPLWIDQQAYDAAEAISAIGKRVLQEQNATLAAKNLGEISEKAWWVPPQEYQGKHVTYLVDPTLDGGKVVHTLAANTAGDLNRMMEQLPENIRARIDNKTLLPRSYNQVKEFHQIEMRDWFNIVDPSVSAQAIGKRSKGSGSSPFTMDGLQALEEAQTSINKRVNHTASDAMKALYYPQLQHTRIAMRASEASKPLNKIAARNRTVYDMYQDAILGNRSRTRETRVGSVVMPVEDMFDEALAKLHDALSGRRPGEIIKRFFINTYHGSKNAADEIEFKQLKNAMGAMLPVESGVELAASRFNISPPKRLVEVAADLNRITSALTLRWAEMAHPILNISGVVNTMPAVMSFFTRRADESITDYALRTGQYGHVINTSSGPLGVLDTTKIMIRALKNTRTHSELPYIAKMGYGAQAVSEIQHTLGSMGQIDTSIRKIGRHVDEWLGKASDKSEEFSRLWSHMAGLEIAEKFAGITGLRERHMFAHNFANQVVGDYLALNRPQVFQGGVGLPLGLFQTYMFGYFQRVFRYIETGNKRALAIQAAMQGTVYGGATLPGFDTYTQMLMGSQDGALDPIESMHDRLGTGLTNVLLHGTISSVPKLFGAPDGISLYTRGDISPRVPLVDGAPAGLSLIGNVMAGLGRGIDMFREGHPGVTNQELLEIASMMFTNRPLRGLLETAAGYAVDKQGNVTADNTLSAMSIASRIIGLKPMAETAQADAYFRNRVVQSQQYAKRTLLRTGTKAAFRSGDLSPELLKTAMTEYLGSGGNPAYFTSWLRDTYLTATTPRQITQMLDAVKGGEFAQAMRILHAGAMKED